MNKIGLFFTIFILSCNSATNKDASHEDSLTIKSEGVTVQTISIKPQNFQKQIIANGIIEAQQKSDLRFNTSERLTLIKVKNGQKVKKGHVIATLNNNIARTEISKAKIEIDKATIKLQEEEINYSFEASNDSTIQKNLKIKSGTLEAENNLENANLLYNQTILTAPFNGVIANVETRVGDFITSSDVFCTIINQQNMMVSFSVLENELTYIKNKQELEITSFVNPDSIYSGAVSEINPFVDENGLVKIKADLKNSDSSLFDGMHAKVYLNLPIKDVVVIPKSALVLRSNKEVVFTVENGLAKWNYVEKLDENSTSYAIKKGLKIGDSVIVSGNMNISHDAKINVQNDDNE